MGAELDELVGRGDGEAGDGSWPEGHVGVPVQLAAGLGQVDGEGDDARGAFAAVAPGDEGGDVRAVVEGAVEGKLGAVEVGVDGVEVDGGAAVELHADAVGVLGGDRDGDRGGQE